MQLTENEDNVMGTGSAAIKAQKKVKPNRALYERFLDLPRSERDKMQAELEKLGLWWHFKSYLCLDGTDLGDAKLKVIPIIGYYLGVSFQELATNNVDVQPYEVFSAKRNQSPMENVESITA